jgi:DNA repair exonuclease SbcCD ATPase subunit
MIDFQIVRWKNLLSTGNVFTEIKLDKSPNTLIVGENGAGKSTILDALCFGLYGKAFRKIKKDQLINSINGRDVVVEIEFKSYNRQYKIVRGIKPTIFEIYQDGELLNQTAAAKDYQEILERNILRMNMKSFTQIVILGSSSFVPFMQLPASTRRDVIEDLLDIRIFSTMSTLLKSRISAGREEYMLNDKDMSATKDMIRLQKENQDRVSRDNDKIINESISLISSAKTRIQMIEEQIEQELIEINEYLAQIDDYAKVSNKLSEIDKIESGLESKKRNAKKSISFYQENDVCPTCTQSLDETIKKSKIYEKQETIDSIEKALQELTQQQLNVQVRLNQIVDIQKTIQSKQQNISNSLHSKIKADRREISILNDRIRDLSNNTSDEVQSIIEDLQTKLEILDNNHQKLANLRETHDIASVILRDTGIKSRIIKQYVPVINALVNKYLAAMDFFVKFELNETFEEKILSRHRDDFTYDSFSEGEKMRIDLALLFTWRTVARMKNSASTNLLILDEVFDASLDANGCEEFLKLIHTLENANVFVISHKSAILSDKFRSTIRFEKHRNFSRVSSSPDAI